MLTRLHACWAMSVRSRSTHVGTIILTIAHTQASNACTQEHVGANTFAFIQLRSHPPKSGLVLSQLHDLKRDYHLINDNQTISN